MEIKDRIFDSILLLENQRFFDDRGSFQEFFNRRKLEDLIPELGCAQINLSRSLPNVVRGLHFQFMPAQGKLVGAIRGAVWDAVVDVRAESPTFGKHFAIELSADNNLMLWIPSGFAHGFCVAKNESADVLYVTDTYYNPRAEGGIFWKDPELAIPWPLRGEAILSERDRKLPLFRETGIARGKPDHSPVASPPGFPLT